MDLLDHELVNDYRAKANPSEDAEKKTASDRVAAKLRISPGRLQEKGSEQLAKAKLYARQRDPSSLNDAVLVAGFHAKKLGKTMWVYEGNSFMHMVYRVTMKESDALNAINNTGDRVVSVTPDLQVFMHEVQRHGDTKTAHGAIDHELVNDLASAYRGKRMRDGIRDMEMAGVPEPVAEEFYRALGEHADEVRGELHRLIEEDDMGEGCGCGCGADCPCMKERVASRFEAALTPEGKKHYGV